MTTAGEIRTLLLLRHAKSSWSDPDLPDFQRPLSKRGREAAPSMGREMRRRGWLPDLALVSTAVRTRQTWQLVAAELDAPIPTRFEASIYEAPATDILEVIRTVPDDVRTLLVVGHNPGLEDAAAIIAGPDSATPVMKRLREKYPTGALALFRTRAAWRDLDERGAALTDFIVPKDIAS